MATAQGIQLCNPISGQREGFIALIPIYRHDAELNSVDERRQTLRHACSVGLDAGARARLARRSESVAPHGDDGSGPHVPTWMRRIEDAMCTIVNPEAPEWQSPPTEPPLRETP